MLKENLSFVGICVLVFAALLGLAYLFERTVCRDLQRRSRSRNISYVAMFSALGGVLMLLEIPLFFAPGFYKIDLSELPVLMSAFYLGPVAGVITELLKVLLKLLLKGTSTAFVGDFANFVVGCTFVLPAAVIYHHHKTRRTAIIGMAVGIGMYVCSLIATGLVLVTLISFEQIEKRRKLGQESKVIGLTVNGIIKDVEPYRKVFDQYHVHLSTYYLEYNYDAQTTEINFVVLTHAYENLLPVLDTVSKVMSSKKLTLSSQLDI